MSLDLDSQHQILSRLQFVTRFSSNLVQITGEQGAGRSWLVERYLESWAKDTSQALLICNARQDDARQRAIILGQLVHGSVFNEQDSLLDSLQHLLGDQPCQLLIAIDDAHCLSPNMVAELWALVQHAKIAQGWQVNVLAFSLKGKLDKCLRQVSYGQGSTPLEVEIPHLTDSEREMLIELMLTSQGLDAGQRRIFRMRAANVPSLPGALFGLQQQEVPVSKEKRDRRFTPAILLALLLILLGLGGLGWYLLGGSPVEKAVPVVTTPEPGATDDDKIPSLETAIDEGKINTDDDKVLAGQNSEAGLPPVVDDSAALPEDSEFAGLTVGRRDDGKRLVVPDTVVDAIMEDQSVGGDGTRAVAEPLLPELAGKTQVTLPDPLATDSKPLPKPAANANKAPAPQTVATSDLDIANTELRDVPAERYALQLAALRSETEVNTFIQDNSLQGKVKVYQTVRSGEPWFMVIWGDYASVNAARRAEMDMPQNLQALGPWVKSFARIHREIDRVNL